MNDTNRAAVPAHVARILERPVRWAPEDSYLPAFDGHERTLHVYNTSAAEQFTLLEKLEPHRPTLEALAGGPLVVLFFSPAQSVRHLRP